LGVRNGGCLVCIQGLLLHPECTCRALLVLLLRMVAHGPKCVV
jgi:hypothetical protein